MRKAPVPALVLACLAALPQPARSAPGRAAALDPARIHADYQAGEFEKVIRALEAFRESGRRCRKADSVFLEKHLAVVYAAHPGTRERGRYHMLRMLSLEPEADLLDMFVGEEVDGIFEKVRKESRLRLPAPEKDRAAHAPRNPEAPQGPATRSAADAGPSDPSTPAPARGGLSTARSPRLAFPDAGAAPRLKAWNLEPAPFPGRGPRPPRKAGASRAAANGITPELRASGSAIAPASRLPSTRSRPEAGRSLGTAPADPVLPAWDLDRTASAGPAMGLLPPEGPEGRGTHGFDGAEASRPRGAALALPPAQGRNEGLSGPRPAGDGEGQGQGPKPRWKEKRVWVGGTVIAAVLGLTAYYMGSQDWSEPASKSRTYGVAAKPNGQ